MEGDDVGFQVVASVSTVFAIWAGEATWATLVVCAHMSGEVGPPRESSRTERALEAEVRV